MKDVSCGCGKMCMKHTDEEADRCIKKYILNQCDDDDI